MKKRNTFLILGLIVAIISCKKSDDDGIDNTQLVQDKLAGTWVVSSVDLDNISETDAFANFQIELDANLGFTSNSTSIQRLPNPWAETGSFTLPDQVADVNNILITRNDGAAMLFTFSDDSNVTLAFNFSATNVGSGGRVEAVEGDWVFSFVKK